MPRRTCYSIAVVLGCLSIAACGSPQVTRVPVEVKVPVRVPCPAPDVPSADKKVSKLPPHTDDFRTAALWAKKRIVALEGERDNLRDALDVCIHATYDDSLSRGVAQHGQSARFGGEKP